MARFLPEWFSPSGEVERPTASEINDLATTQQTVTVAGYNEPVPFVYGEQQTGGPIIAGPVSLLSNRSLVYAVALCRSGDRAIGGINGLLINGVDQGAVPALGANPTLMTKDAIQFRMYNGTQTTHDATLRSALGNDFSDVFHETAYVVITVPESKSSDFNLGSSIVWTVRGRQCFDPRNNTWAWTENPSLHLYDFATCQKYGLARDVIGIAECADWNDSLYSGLPRARTGLVINEALEEYQIMDLLSTYAECLWSYEGDAIRVIADAPVDAPADTITKSQIRDGTFDIRGSDQSNVPTALSVIFSDRSRPAEWGSIPAHVQSPDHEVFGSISTQSDVQLLGVYRRVEAERRAWSRFMRLQVPGKISFQMFDDGIKYQLGDVLRIPDYMGVRSLMIRITAQVEPVDIGIYQIHGEVYKNDFYPEGLAGALVPEGGVLFTQGTSTRLGYDLISSKNALLYSSTEGGGVKPSISDLPQNQRLLSTSLMVSGQHGGGLADIVVPKITFGTTDKDAPPAGARAGDSVNNSGHVHHCSIDVTSAVNGSEYGKVGVSAYKRDSGDIHSDRGLCYLSPEVAPRDGYEEQDLGVGLIELSSIKNTQPSKSGSAVSTAAGLHNHYTDLPGLFRNGYPSSVINSYTMMSGQDGEHGHRVGYNKDWNPRRVKVILYKSDQEFALIPTGGIIGFVGDGIPQGWALCDGSNGTTDLRNMFFEVGGNNPVGAMSGNNQASVTFPTSVDSYSHNHPDGLLRSGRWQTEVAGTHMRFVSHTHATNGGGSRTFNYTPERYEMKFIQYIGE